MYACISPEECVCRFTYFSSVRLCRTVQLWKFFCEPRIVPKDDLKNNKDVFLVLKIWRQRGNQKLSLQKNTYWTMCKIPHASLKTRLCTTALYITGSLCLLRNELKPSGWGGWGQGKEHTEWMTAQSPNSFNEEGWPSTAKTQWDSFQYAGHGQLALCGQRLLEWSWHPLCLTGPWQEQGQDPVLGGGDSWFLSPGMRESSQVWNFVFMPSCLERCWHLQHELQAEACFNDHQHHPHSHENHLQRHRVRTVISTLLKKKKNYKLSFIFIFILS